jgi:hypothetical protein
MLGMSRRMQSLGWRKGSKNKKLKGDYLINGAISTWHLLKINSLQTVMDNNSKVYVLEGVASKK